MAKIKLKMNKPLFMLTRARASAIAFVVGTDVSLHYYNYNNHKQTVNSNPHFTHFELSSAILKKLRSSKSGGHFLCNKSAHGTHTHKLNIFALNHFWCMFFELAELLGVKSRADALERECARLKQETSEKEVPGLVNLFEWNNDWDERPNPKSGASRMIFLVR